MKRGALLGALGGVVAVAAATGAAAGLTGYGSGTGSPAELTVSGGYIPRPLLTDEAAAYVTVTNSGGTDAQLTSVSSSLAEHVSLHTTTGTTMRQATSLTVPAGGRLTLETGGNHLMLETLTHMPSVGERITLRLHFTNATPATVTLTVPVRPTAYHPKG